ncbi:MAG: hypothetical protein HQK60_15095 [Deltaproteobacteria bacterium]|nr:hypothetical protein [Deltaproteobacteria bacterium]
MMTNRTVPNNMIIAAAMSRASHWFWLGTLLVELILLIISPWPGPSAWAGSETEVTRFIRLMPGPAAIDGFKYLKDPAVWPGEKLFEYMDGGAEVFLRHGFRLLAAGDLVSTDGRRTITLEIFLMNSFMEAVAAYSTFFPNLGLASEMGAASYASGNTVAFVKGQYFVRAFATSGEGDHQVVLSKIAETVARRLSVNPSLPREAAWFQAIQPRSVKYLPNNIWGLEYLGAGFTAELTRPAGEISIFLSRFPSSEAAVEAGQKCRRQLGNSCASDLGPIPIKAIIVVCVDDPNRGRMVILQKGPYLAGATSFKILFDLNPLKILLGQVPE